MFGRIIRHVLATRHGVRRAFPEPALLAIEQAVAHGETQHSGQVRFAIETELAWPALLAGMPARHRALEVFSQLRVWDTERNNGVLIYVLFADHQVEIVADRGFNGRVGPERWHAICEAMRARFAQGDFQAGAVAGVEAVSQLIAGCFPAEKERPGDAMPDRPVIL